MKTLYTCEDCNHKWEDEIDGIHCLNRDGSYNQRIYKIYFWNCPNCNSRNVLELSLSDDTNDLQKINVKERIQINSFISEQDELKIKDEKLDIELIELIRRIC